MKVLKIVAEGLTTSFRYPHFIQKIHPSYHMPPPSTIYGHICSAIGELVDREGIAFAYHFTHQGLAQDLEHIHVIEAKGKTFEYRGKNYQRVQEGTVNPYERDILFKPKLTLYLNKPEWEDYFRSPRYPVVLGRSQDLFTYIEIQTVELQKSEQMYVEHTLAPYDMALKLQRGIPIKLPRFFDRQISEVPEYGYYVILDSTVPMKNDGTLWSDPTSRVRRQAQLGLFFHTFTEDDNNGYTN